MEDGGTVYMLYNESRHDKRRRDRSDSELRVELCCLFHSLVLARGIFVQDRRNKTSSRALCAPRVRVALEGADVTVVDLFRMITYGACTAPIWLTCKPRGKNGFVCRHLISRNFASGRVPNNWKTRGYTGILANLRPREYQPTDARVG